jgi:hypothetical protein
VPPRCGWTPPAGRVFAGVRREEDGEALREAGGEGLVPLILDVTDAEEIAAARQVETATEGPT